MAFGGLRLWDFSPLARIDPFNGHNSLLIWMAWSTRMFGQLLRSWTFPHTLKSARAALMGKYAECRHNELA